MNRESDGKAFTASGRDDASPALLIYDGAGRLVGGSHAASLLIGIPEAELAGTLAGEDGMIVWRGPGRARRSRHPVVTAIKTRKPARGLIANAQQPENLVQFVATPILSAGGQVEYVIASLTEAGETAVEIASAQPELKLTADLTAQTLTGRQDAEAILRVVTTTLSRIRPGTWVATLMNRDPTTSRVLVVDDADTEVADYVDRYMAFLLGPGQAPTTGLAQYVIETGKPLLRRDLSSEDLLALVTPAQRDFIAVNPPPPTFLRSPLGFLVVPMRSRGARIGMLGVFTRGLDAPPKEKEIEWLQAIADRTGMAIDNAQLQAAAADRLDRLNALQSVTAAINETLDLRRNLQVILEQLVRGLRIDAADLLTVDEQSGTLRVTSSTGFLSTSIPDLRFPIDQSLIEWAALGQHLDSLEEVNRLGQFRRQALFAREGFAAFRAVPLIARDRLRGVLEVFRRSPFQPDGEAIAFLDVMASLAALAIDHSPALTNGHKPALQAHLQSGPRRPAPVLTPVEREILRLLVEGRTNKAIGAEVHLAEDTVKFYVRRLLSKTETDNRTELAREATRAGWI